MPTAISRVLRAAQLPYRRNGLRIATATSGHAVAILATVAQAAIAQVTMAQGTVRVVGSVRDSVGHGLAGAQVTVIGLRAATFTNAVGAFRLDVPDGAWSLILRKLGYRPDTLLVVVPGPVVQARLHRDAVLLRSITVVDEGQAFGTRTVPRTTIRNTPSLLESDVFRALTFVPEVTQPNDLKGRLHLAGGASDETGYALDGHPLQEPFHLLGLLGAFPSAALERADVSVHYLPARLDGRLGGVINFETLTPSDPGTTELSLGLISASATAARSWDHGRYSAILAGRSTYLDKLLETWGNDLRLQGDAVPLMRYRDVVGSVHLGRSYESQLQATLFASRDSWLGPTENGRVQSALDWGETMVGLRGRRQLAAGWVATARGSWSRARQCTRICEAGPGNISFTHDWMSATGEIERLVSAQTLASFGVALDMRRVDDRWDAEGYDVVFSPRLPLLATSHGSQTIPALFAQASSTRGRFTVNAGFRVSRIDDAAALAPRLHVTYAFSPGWRGQVGYSRRYQSDAQLEEPQEGNILQPLFILPSARVADVGALSLVHTGGVVRPRRIEAAFFAKRYTHRATLVSNPRHLQDSSGTLPTPFPDFLRTDGTAYGGSLDALWPVSTRLFLQGAYTYQRSLERVGGEDAPTDWDTPHRMNAFASYQLSRTWRANVAWQGRSGLPITPVVARVYAPTDLLDLFLQSRYVYGRRNSGRTAGFSRLDVGLQRSWTRGTKEWEFGLQALNTTFNTNPYAYDWRAYFCWEAGACRSPRPSRRGMPLLPSLYLSVRW
jgi:hypothetical protein